MGDFKLAGGDGVQGDPGIADRHEQTSSRAPAEHGQLNAAHKAQLDQPEPPFRRYGETGEADSGAGRAIMQRHRTS
uniref:Uncharacterized protein n=1 Tax=Streptomyces sp. NBC_00003 TaxID=2903608 RepID=A0AAU2VCT3_9ACTN